MKNNSRARYSSWFEIRKTAATSLREIFLTYAPEKLKGLYWDYVYSSGRYDCLEESLHDCIYPFIENYLERAEGGSILDLGCGSGSTASKLEVKYFEYYLGVDVSELSLEKARTKTADKLSSGKLGFVKGDIFKYTPTRHYDVILFRDSIYYFSTANILRMLNRYAQYLTDRGVFLVRMWNGDNRFRTIIQTIIHVIEANFVLLEKQVFYAPDAIVLVFRSQPQA